MKAQWKGSINFGLVSIPVKLYKATEDKALKFHQYHAGCQGRIRYNKVCASCALEVAASQIVRGYEYDEDRYVVLTDDELDRGLSKSRAIGIMQFVDAAEIDPIYFAESYYLGPEEISATGYQLLAEAMRQTAKIAVATLTLRDKQRPAVLRLYGEVIALHTLHWPDEIRSSALDHLGAGAELRPQEIDMACSLVSNLAGSFDPTSFVDSYRQRLEELVEAKIAGQTPPEEPAAPKATVLDLMAALQASVEQTTAPKTAHA